VALAALLPSALAGCASVGVHDMQSLPLPEFTARFARHD
jgi:hypothetical protein